MPDSSRFVAIGLLTQRDLDVLGSGFHRAFPLDDRHVFDDLLRAIDAAESEANRERAKPTRSKPG